MRLKDLQIWAKNTKNRLKKYSQVVKSNIKWYMVH